MSGRRYLYRRSPPGFAGLSTLPAHSRGAIPTLIDNTNLVVGVLDQGQLGSCELNSWAQAIRAQEIVQAATDLAGESGCTFDEALVTIMRSPPELAARLAMYFAAQAYGGYAGQGDTGTTSQDVMTALSMFGYCRESEVPYVDSENAIDPGALLEQVKRLAFDQRFTETARVDSDMMTADEADTAIANALAGRHLVAYATDVDQAFENLTPGKIWPGPTGQSLGGHCVTIVARGPANKLSKHTTSTAIVYKILNSWSAEWDEGGYLLMSVGALRDRYDACVVVQTPTFSGTV